MNFYKVKRNPDKEYVMVDKKNYLVINSKTKLPKALDQLIMYWTYYIDKWKKPSDSYFNTFYNCIVFRYEDCCYAITPSSLKIQPYSLFINSDVLFNMYSKCIVKDLIAIKADNPHHSYIIIH